MADPRQPTRQERRRQALVSAWRGCFEPLPERKTLQVSEVVLEVAKQTGFATRVSLERVLEVWRSAVGDFLANQSHPHSIDRGVLLVRVMQPTVHHVLAQQRSQVVARLKALMGAEAPRDVRFKLG
jgi:hypothetical protein